MVVVPNSAMRRVSHDLGQQCKKKDLSFGVRRNFPLAGQHTDATTQAVTLFALKNKHFGVAFPLKRHQTAECGCLRVSLVLPIDAAISTSIQLPKVLLFLLARLVWPFGLTQPHPSTSSFLCKITWSKHPRRCWARWTGLAFTTHPSQIVIVNVPPSLNSEG